MQWDQHPLNSMQYVLMPSLFTISISLQPLSFKLNNVLIVLSMKYLYLHSYNKIYFFICCSPSFLNYYAAYKEHKQSFWFKNLISSRTIKQHLSSWQTQKMSLSQCWTCLVCFAPLLLYCMG